MSGNSNKKGTKRSAAIKNLGIIRFKSRKKIKKVRLGKTPSRIGKR
jgi:hypothetical protein